MPSTSHESICGLKSSSLISSVTAAASSEVVCVALCQSLSTSCTCNSLQVLTTQLMLIVMILMIQTCGKLWNSAKRQQQRKLLPGLLQHFYMEMMFHGKSFHGKSFHCIVFFSSLSLVSRHLLFVCICVQSTLSDIAKKMSRQVTQDEPFDIVV